MNTDLISRQAAIDAIRKDVMGGLNYEGILTRLPSVTPKQRTGHWISWTDEPVEIKNGSPVESSWCSECGEWLVASDEYDCNGNFCPNCGAKMESEEEQA